MADVLEEIDRSVRFVYGRPEVVEAEIERVHDTYTCTNLFFYVVENHLEVAATLMHQKEIRRAQLAMTPVNPNFKMRPN